MLGQRLNWDEYFLEIAKTISKRGTCIRRNYGAVVVKKNKIISTGYCGAPKGLPNCSDIEKCFRQEYSIPSGQNYNLCRSVHAEMNAIAGAGFENTKGGKLYIYGEEVETGKICYPEPCTWCKRFIIQGEIKEVIIKIQEGIKKISVQSWIDERIKEPFKDQLSELEKKI